MKKLLLIFCLSAAAINAMDMNTPAGSANNTHQNHPQRSAWAGSCAESCSAACYCCCLIAAAPIFEGYLRIREKIKLAQTSRHME
jgi:hypothetical protein